MLPEGLRKTETRQSLSIKHSGAGYWERSGGGTRPIAAATSENGAGRRLTLPKEDGWLGNEAPAEVLGSRVNALAAVPGGEEAGFFFRGEEAEVGGIAGEDFVIEAEEGGGMTREGVPSGFEAESGHFLRAEDAREGSEGRAGESARVGESRRAVRTDPDHDLAEGVGTGWGGGTGHGVGGEEESRGGGTSEALGKGAKGVGWEMEAVGDEGGSQAGLGEDVEDDVVEFRDGGRDGVAEVGPADGTGVDGALKGVADGFGVAEEEGDAVFDPGADDVESGGGFDLGGEGDELEEVAHEGAPVVEEAEAGRLHPLGAMCATGTGTGIEPGAFQVKAEAVAGTAGDSLGKTGEEVARRFLAVGDEGDEKAGAAVGVELVRGMLPGVVGFEGAVEIDSGETVDLEIDEAGGDPGKIGAVAAERDDALEDGAVDFDGRSEAGKSTGDEFHAATSRGSRVKRMRTLQRMAEIRSTTGRMRTPVWRFWVRSEIEPTTEGEMKSPKRWIMKVQRAMELARRWTGTISNNSLQMGPVGRKRKNMPTPSPMRERVALPTVTAKKQMGVATIMERAMSQT